MARVGPDAEPSAVSDALAPNDALEVGRWYQIEMYVRNNTPGENDGVLRAWVDGEQVFERADVRFRDVERLHLERVWMDVYYGGSWSAPRDMYLEIDNVVIAWERIGLVDDEGIAPIDGGVSATDAGVRSDAGFTAPAADGGRPAADAGSASMPPAAESSTMEGGCGCAVPRGTSDFPLAAPALVLFVAVGCARARARAS